MALLPFLPLLPHPDHFKLYPVLTDVPSLPVPIFCFQEPIWECIHRGAPLHLASYQCLDWNSLHVSCGSLRPPPLLLQPGELPGAKDELRSVCAWPIGIFVTLQGCCQESAQGPCPYSSKGYKASVLAVRLAVHVVPCWFIVRCVNPRVQTSCRHCCGAGLSGQATAAYAWVQ